MNKELEALERMTEHLDLDDEYFYKQEKEDEKIIKQALQRLESIDNANPSEALKELENIEADLTGLPKHVTEYDDGFDNYLEDIWNNIDTIKQALIKAQKDDKTILGIEDYLNKRIKIEPIEDVRKAFIEIRNHLQVIKEVVRMKKYMLRLLGDGDIDIITESDRGCYEIVYHKTYNPTDDIKENLDNAYKEWERLTKESIKGDD